MKFLPEESEELDNRAIEIIQQFGSVDAPELASILGITAQSARRLLTRLVSWGTLHAKRTGRLVRFSYGGEPAPKREASEYKPFDGVNWASSTMRPGCQDFLKAPSLVHGERIEHRAPIHGCVSSAPQVRSEA
jgi:hypothetical protein